MSIKSAALNPSEIFSLMVVSSVFEPRSASIEDKRQVFSRFWVEVPWLCANFNSSGIEIGGDGLGFGFLVESIAYHSARLPKRNTEKGEALAQTILSEFQLGKRSRLVRANGRMSNSDYLWLNQIGRLITITGIGEVKASYLAASRKIGGQLKRQEQSLKFLVTELESIKSRGALPEFFQKRRVKIAGDLERFLIVPFGEGEKIRQDSNFSDWQVVELEFSYGELQFIAQKIWPDFRPEIKIGPGPLASLDRIADEFRKRTFGSLDGPFFELGLFLLATGKTPDTESELELAVGSVRECYWVAVQRCLNSLINNSNSRPGLDFSERERWLFKKFWYVLTSDRGELENFIYFTRSLASVIKDFANKKGWLNQLKIMAEAPII